MGLGWDRLGLGSSDRISFYEKSCAGEIPSSGKKILLWEEILLMEEVLLEEEGIPSAGRSFGI